jgi:hypothetical protein
MLTLWQPVKLESMWFPSGDDESRYQSMCRTYIERLLLCVDPYILVMCGARMYIRDEENGRSFEGGSSRRHELWDQEHSSPLRT